MVINLGDPFTPKVSQGRFVPKNGFTKTKSWYSESLPSMWSKRTKNTLQKKTFHRLVATHCCFEVMFGRREQCWVIKTVRALKALWGRQPWVRLWKCPIETKYQKWTWVKLHLWQKDNPFSTLWLRLTCVCAYLWYVTWQTLLQPLCSNNLKEPSSRLSYEKERKKWKPISAT